MFLTKKRSFREPTADRAVTMAFLTYVSASSPLRLMSRSKYDLRETSRTFRKQPPSLPRLLASPTHPVSVLEGMLAVAPAEDVKDFVVDTDRDGEAHDGHGDSGEHGDDAELEQGQQADHQPRQHHAGPLRVLPVDQVHHWDGRRRDKERVLMLLTHFFIVNILFMSVMTEILTSPKCFYNKVFDKFLIKYYIFTFIC